MMKAMEFLSNLGVRTHEKAMHNPKNEKTKTEFVKFLEEKQAKSFSKKREAILDRLRGEGI